MQALAPARLPASEQLRILRRLHSQNPIDLSSDDACRLVQSAIGMVLRLAAPYAKNRDLHEDIVQAGRLGILRAIATFDLSRNLQFSTHCLWQIRSRVSDEVDRFNRFSKRNRATDPVLMETASAPDAIDSESAENVAHNVECRDRVSGLFRLLSSQQREVVRMAYGIDSEAMTYREIASRLGMEKSQVHATLQVARSRMIRQRRQRLMDFGE